ncbi:hypothetical protein Aau02nite_10800 [Amorphoplanes auranticolor]|uniref:histidine kinase n=1 Tax=Actinoplanes auranticolor TaxID=47988 RepID=A0A919S5N8_9ACTN|nr:hypothetical protein Aau02nite_10800 [Actinoplanes auranticolor]
MNRVRRYLPDGLARLDALVDRTRAVGVSVAVDVAGPLASLPAAVDLAAYRIVQEPLTNVLRHAGTATASVRLALTDDDLTVSVSDTGRDGRAHAGPGRPRPRRHEGTRVGPRRLVDRGSPPGRRLRRHRHAPGAPMTPQRTISVVIADDQDLVRLGRAPCWAARTI